MSVPVGVLAGLLIAYGLGLFGRAAAEPRSELLAATDNVPGLPAPAGPARCLASAEGRARVTPRPWAMVPIESEATTESAPGPLFSTGRMAWPASPKLRPEIDEPRFLPRSGWIYDILRAGRLPANYERWNQPGADRGPDGAPIPSLLPARTAEGAAETIRPATARPFEETPQPGLPQPEVPESSTAAQPKTPPKAEPETGFLSGLRAWIPPFPTGVAPYPRKDEPRSLLPKEYEPERRPARGVTSDGTTPIPIAGY